MMQPIAGSGSDASPSRERAIERERITDRARARSRAARAARRAPSSAGTRRAASSRARRNRPRCGRRSRSTRAPSGSASSSCHCSGVAVRAAMMSRMICGPGPPFACCWRWISGSVTLPSRRSLPIGLPTASASPVKSSRSSTIWNAIPRLKPYSRSACSCSPRHLAQHPADLRAAAEQVRRLAAHDVEVLVLGDVGVAVLGQLIQLALDHPQRDVAEQPDDVELVVRERHRHRLDVQVVAEQHRDVVAPARVHGEAARGASRNRR